MSLLNNLSLRMRITLLTGGIVLATSLLLTISSMYSAQKIFVYDNHITTKATVPLAVVEETVLSPPTSYELPPDRVAAVVQLIEYSALKRSRNSRHPCRWNIMTTGESISEVFVPKNPPTLVVRSVSYLQFPI